ncbi:MAG: hypothetical protein HYY06_08920 [Deltaproteobacteria bacterium]|nr:hypothetical protein [Deltaproteobacteria bacterium]
MDVDGDDDVNVGDPHSSGPALAAAVRRESQPGSVKVHVHVAVKVHVKGDIDDRRNPGPCNAPVAPPKVGERRALR